VSLSPSYLLALVSGRHGRGLGKSLADLVIDEPADILVAVWAELPVIHGEPDAREEYQQDYLRDGLNKGILRGAGQGITIVVVSV
jgi:hypothetical protein